MDGQVLRQVPEDGVPLRPGFEQAQRALAHFNKRRLAPGGTEDGVPDDHAMAAGEEAFVRSFRHSVAPLLAELPTQPGDFMRWFQDLKESGPGQGDALFPWLATQATHEQLRWFLAQEVAGEAGFEDLLAMTQVKMPARAKLEMARNFWDEMGRGREDGMHGPMLERLAQALDIRPAIETTAPAALALGNMMVALAFNRRYAFQSIGALGVIELTAPTRAGHVVQALDRLGVPRRDSHYFALHAVIDVKHSRAWNSEVIETLVSEDSSRIGPIAEGAMIRLWCGLLCFDRYRQEFGVGS